MTTENAAVVNALLMWNYEILKVAYFMELFCLSVTCRSLNMVIQCRNAKRTIIFAKRAGKNL